MVKYLIILLFAGYLIAGCSPVKRTARLQQQYEQMVNDYIAKHPPRIDTATKYLPGKIDSVPFPVPVINEQAVKIKADSITKYLRDKYLNGLKDCDRQVNEAYNTGYQQARYEISKTKIADKKPDTLTHTIYNTDAVSHLQNELAACSARCAEIDRAKKEKNIWIYTTIAGAVTSLLLLFVVVKNLFKVKPLQK